MEWYYAEDGGSIGPNSLDAMKHHIKNGRIFGDTMIWTPAFGNDWKPLKTVAEFASLFVAPPSSGPPPPPPQSAAPPNPPAPPPLRPSAGDAMPPEPPQIDYAVPPRTPRNDDRFSVAPPSARDALSTAGPWSRYFARQIDITIWSLVAVLALVFGLAVASPPTYYRLMTVPPAAIGMLSVFLGIVINGIVVGIFGNSIGKAIFGIRVYKVGSDGKLPFGSALIRELRVWVFGLGIGFPIATLVAVIIQYRKVAATGSTGYDTGRFLVKQKKVGAVRITLGIILAILLIGGVALLNAWGSMPTRSTPVSWTNPDSQISTTISSVWQVDRQTADDGATSSILSNSDTGENILVGLETYSGGSLNAYTDALSKSLAASATISQWTGNGLGGSTATGKLTENAIPIDLYVYKIGDRYWRVLSFDMTARKSGHFIDQTILAAVLKTLN